MLPAAKVHVLSFVAACSGALGVLFLVVAFSFWQSARVTAVLATPILRSTTPADAAEFGSAGGWAYAYAAFHATLAVALLVAGVASFRSARRLKRQLHADGPLCPKCGYSLRGLPEPRCPECGTAFEPIDRPRT